MLGCYRRSKSGKGIFKWIHVLLTEHCASKLLHSQKKKVTKKIKRYVPEPEALSVYLINLRSCNNKTALMKQLINDLDLDICSITETWLKEEDEVGKATLKPDGYKILSSPGPSRPDGGIAIIHKENLQVAKSHEYQFGTCECTDFKISFDQFSYTLALFYRPEDHPSMSFINDMVEYMENNITDNSQFLLLGDFNIHINKLHDDEAVTFCDFLSSFSL